jgi:hypothetical protein
LVRYRHAVAQLASALYEYNSSKVREASKIYESYSIVPYRHGVEKPFLPQKQYAYRRALTSPDRECGKEPRNGQKN